MKTRTRGSLTGILVTVTAGALILSACTSTPKKQAAKTTSTTAAPIHGICPLTGQPALSKTVPSRPALAVKVDNYEGARPQAGLDKADIVVEEVAEGSIPRYVAIFQCSNSALIGDIRSARQVDIGILGAYGKPLLAHVGGIDPVLANINASNIVNVDLGQQAQAIIRPPGRVAPYAMFSSTKLLWATNLSSTTVPPAQFTYAKTLPRSAQGQAISSVGTSFGGTAPVVWRWDAAKKAFMRFYNDSPDTNQNGVQNSAANVIVQSVILTYGPWVENAEGGLEVQAALTDTGGPAWIMRDGKYVEGTWKRAGLSDPTKFYDKSDKLIPMAPGRTWVELLPSGMLPTPTMVPVTTTTMGSKSKTSSKKK
ncbi:MAG: DUF3048 domain-containing protein [Actinomycetes bacterium]